jgi:hypothetical protein
MHFVMAKVLHSNSQAFTSSVRNELGALIKERKHIESIHIMRPFCSLGAKYISEGAST